MNFDKVNFSIIGNEIESSIGFSKSFVKDCFTSIVEKISLIFDGMYFKYYNIINILFLFLF